MHPLPKVRKSGSLSVRDFRLRTCWTYSQAVLFLLNFLCNYQLKHLFVKWSGAEHVLKACDNFFQTLVAQNWRILQSRTPCSVVTRQAAGVTQPFRSFPCLDLSKCASYNYWYHRPHPGWLSWIQEFLGRNRQHFAVRAILLYRCLVLQGHRLVFVKGFVLPHRYSFLRLSYRFTMLWQRIM
jgi:hypothetical protein